RNAMFASPRLNQPSLNGQRSRVLRCSNRSATSSSKSPSAFPNKGRTLSNSYTTFIPKPHVLLGPGPSDVPPRVLQAMATPLVGHLDPEFLTLMNSIQDLLRWLFRTENRMTIAISGTGSAGMETCVVNLIEPGDKMIVCVNGVFGSR